MITSTSYRWYSNKPWDKQLTAAFAPTHPVRLWVVEEVGPVGVRLHEPELKQLLEAQHQDVLTDLRKETQRNSLFLYQYR